MKKLLFTSFIILASHFSFVNAAVYVGSGVTIYKTKYQSEIVRINQDLTLNGNVITNIQMQAPTNNNGIQLLSINDITLPDANGAYYIVGCVDSSGVVIDRITVDGECNNGVFAELNKEQVLIDFGMQFLNYTQVNLAGFSQKEKLDLALYTAQNVLSNFAGGANINSVNDIFDIFNDQQNKPLNVNAGVYMQLIVDRTDENEVNKWGEIITNFKNSVLNGLGLVNDMVYRSTDAQSGIGGFISFGFLDAMKVNKKIFYGFEGMLGLENLQIENSKVDDFALRSHISVSFIGRLGYSFGKNSLSYVNAGFGLQEYKVEQKGFIDEKFLIPYALIGVGLEFAISPSYNIFGEYNYSFNTKKIYPQHTLVESIVVKSKKMNIGVRYYLGGSNIIRTNDIKQNNKVRQNVANAFTKIEEVDTITNYNDVKFRDAKKFGQKVDAEEVDTITNYNDVKFRDAKKFGQKVDASKATSKPKANVSKATSKPKANASKATSKPKANASKATSKPKAKSLKSIQKEKGGKTKVGKTNGDKFQVKMETLKPPVIR
jgi:hypothetical protein